MNKNMKWLACIHQEYAADKAGRTSTGRPNGCIGTLDTLVVLLRVKAPSAQEAVSKAEEWLKESGIENAYVKNVCRHGLEETDMA